MAHAGPPRKYVFTPEMNAELERIYVQGDYMRNGALGRFAARWRIPRWVASRQGQFLGLARIKEKPWSDEEIRALEANAHLHTIYVARKLRKLGFERTATAVALKRKRMRIQRDGYTCGRLADVMGVDRNKVHRWIKAGLLRAQSIDNPRRDDHLGKHYFIRPCWVREFLLNSACEWDHRRVDKYWMIDILTNLNAG